MHSFPAGVVIHRGMNRFVLTQYQTGVQCPPYCVVFAIEAGISKVAQHVEPHGCFSRDFAPRQRCGDLGFRILNLVT
jgi:hypothetical protein